MSNEQEKPTAPTNQIAWLLDKPVAREQKGGPKRNYKGVIVVNESNTSPNIKRLQKDSLKSNRLPNNMYLMAEILAINLKDFGIVFIGPERSSIHFRKGSRVKVQKNLAEIHSNMGIHHKEWREVEEIFDSLKNQKIKLNGGLDTNIYPKTDTLKEHLWALNSIYQQKGLNFRIVSECAWKDGKKTRVYRILNIDSPESIVRYRKNKTLQNI